MLICLYGFNGYKCTENSYQYSGWNIDVGRSNCLGWGENVVEGPKTCESLPKKRMKTWEGINARTKVAYNSILTQINLLENNKNTHTNL